MAAEYTTAIVLDAPVDKDSVQMDTPPGAPHLRVLAVGEHSVHFETLMTPGEKERWVLRVRYADGAQPEWAAFALVARPGGEVDMRINAVRPRQPLEDCQEQLAAAQARCEGARAEARGVAAGAVVLGALLACGVYLALRTGAPAQPSSVAKEAPSTPSSTPVADAEPLPAPPTPSPLAQPPPAQPPPAQPSPHQRKALP